MTDYCNQGGLDGFIGVKEFNIEMQKKCMLEIALGIKYLHGKDIAHRDIKPDNIFVHNYAIKIGDFGNSKAIENSKGKTVCGTPFYMAE